MRVMVLGFKIKIKLFSKWILFNLIVFNKYFLILIMCMVVLDIGVMKRICCVNRC